MEDRLKIVIKPEDTLGIGMQEQEPLQLRLGNAAIPTGTTNYNELGNKPKINGVTLQGNKSASELGLVNKSGDNMTGTLRAENYVTRWGLEFQNSNETIVGGVYQDMYNNNNQVYFDEFTGAGKRECYLLPSPTAEDTAFYDILTSKTPVTIAQGGTGASTAADAAANLGVVKKTGDTMTGYLHLINGGRVTVHIPSINVSTAPSDTVNQDALSVTDVNESGIAFVRGRQTPNGNTGVEFSARRTIGSTTYFNGVTFEITPTGTRSVGVSEPSAWRNAIGAVNKAGDNMTGALLAPTMKVYDASAPMFVLQSSASDTSALGAVYEDISSRRMVIRQRNTTGYVEDYFFPTNSASANASYEVLTTKQPVTAFKDMTYSISLASGAWTQQSVTQFTTPTGYVRTGISVVGGSTTDIRSYVYALANANANWILLYNASGSAVSGTITLRAEYILQAHSKEFTQ